MVESFTDYQRRMFKTLCLIGVLRYYVDISKKGQYIIKHSLWGEIFFWIFWTNNILKFLYVALTYHKLTGVEVHFLDQMSIWDWIFMTLHAIIECGIWFWKYPLYENLYMQWELQENIYRKLGSPKDSAKKITRTDKINNWLYSGIIWGCTVALTIQYFFTPKYALNTYAILKEDTLPLRILFSIHEIIFMFHGYFYQAFTMVLAQSYSVTYQHLLEEMNGAMSFIIDSGRREARREIILLPTESKTRVESASQMSNSSSDASSESSSRPVSATNPGSPSHFDGKLKSPNNQVRLSPSSKLKRMRIDNIIVPGTEYNILKLVDDYKKIMISALYHNQWIGMVMGVSELINFMQFVSDVFMIFQLLKEPETDYIDVFFYMLDAVCGMTMMFRMLIILSRLVPQAEDFIQGLKTYASLNTPLQKQILKTIPALRVISAKLTGYSVRPESVPVGFNTLINWYICAAMWQRPDDPTRRT